MAIYENPILSGSVTVSGSFNVQGITFISSSNQIASDISGSFTATSASIASRFDGLSTDYNDLTNIPVDIVSSSNQIASDISGSVTSLSSSIATRFDGLTSDYTELTNIPEGIVSSSAQVVASLNNQDVDLGTGDITVVTASIDYALVNDTLQGNGSGFQFFAYNEDTVKVKFVNWYSSNDRQYGMGQLWFETWFAAIDNNPTLRDNRRIGFYLEEPDAGANDAAGGSGAHPSNARFYVDVDGAYLSGSLQATGGITGSSFTGSFVGDGSNLTGVGFPYTGAAEITGSLEVIGGNISGSFNGTYTGDGSGLTGISLEEVTTVTDTFTSTTSKSVTHNFNSKNIFVSVYDNSDQLVVPATLTTTDVNTVTVTFDTATTGRVVVGKAGHVISGSVFGSYREAVSGASTYNVTHNLNVEYPLVQSYLTSTKEQIIPSRILSTSVNAITVEFDDTFAGTIVVKK